MKKRDEPLSALPDPAVRRLLGRLHAKADREAPKLVWRFASQGPRLLFGRKLPWDRSGVHCNVKGDAAIANKGRMEHMKEFFEGVGAADTAGVWEGDPNLRPDFRAQHQKKLDKLARAAKAQEMI